MVALPDQLFYNTGISTYFWVLTTRKSAERRGKVQLVDAHEMFVKRRKSLGEKRKEISDDQIAEITRIYANFEGDGERSKVFPNEAFRFLRVTVERPRRVHWEVSDDTLAAVEAAKPVAKLDAEVADGLLARLRAFAGEVEPGGRRYAAGDRLVALAPNTALGIVTSEPLTVLAAEEAALTLRTSDGRSVVVTGASAYDRAASALEATRRAATDPAATRRQRRAAAKALPALAATMDAAAKQWNTVGEPEAEALRADIRSTDRQLRRLIDQAAGEQFDLRPARGTSPSLEASRCLGL